jgi:hypothetical protein
MLDGSARSQGSLQLLLKYKHQDRRSLWEGTRQGPGNSSGKGGREPGRAKAQVWQRTELESKRPLWAAWKVMGELVSPAPVRPEP